MPEFDPLRSDAPVIVYLDFKSPYAFIAKDPTREMAAERGIHEVNFSGMPIILMRQEGTNKALKARYPLITISMAMDLMTFLKQQEDLRAAVPSGSPVISALDDSIRDDMRELQPGFGVS